MFSETRFDGGVVQIDWTMTKAILQYTFFGAEEWSCHRTVVLKGAFYKVSTDSDETCIAAMGSVEVDGTSAYTVEDEGLGMRIVRLSHADQK